MAHNNLQSLARNVAVISGHVTNLESTGYCVAMYRTDAMFLSPPQDPRRSWPTGKRFPGHIRPLVDFASANDKRSSARFEPMAGMSAGLKRG